MNADDIRTLVVDRLNFLVDRPLAEDLANLLANPDFVGGNLLLERVEYKQDPDDWPRRYRVVRRYATEWQSDADADWSLTEVSE
jgi:hypothetical protein